MCFLDVFIRFNLFFNVSVYLGQFIMIHCNVRELSGQRKLSACVRHAACRLGSAEDARARCAAARPFCPQVSFLARAFLGCFAAFVLQIRPNGRNFRPLGP